MNINQELYSCGYVAECMELKNCGVSIYMYILISVRAQQPKLKYIYILVVL